MNRMRYMRYAALLGLSAALPVAVAVTQPTWRLLRPGMTGIPGDYVQAIYVDAQDHPYVAGYTPFWEEGGLGYFDGDRWTTLNNVESPLITSPRFMEILRGPDDHIWIASDNGILRYDPQVGPASLQLFDRYNTPMPGDHIRDIDFAPDGTLWVAIRNVTAGPAGGLVRFDPATNTWTVWTTANGITWGGDWPGWDGIEHVAVVPDAAGPGYTVWFQANANLGMGTWRDGVWSWKGNPQDLPPGQYPLTFMTNDPVDDEGNLWMRTSEGFARLSRDGSYTSIENPSGVTTQAQKFQPLRNGRAILATYYADVFVYDGAWTYIGNWGGGTHTYALAEDSQGNIWAGGIGGASYYANGYWQRYRITNTGMLSYFIETIDFDADGRVYMNGNGGPGVGGFDIFDGVHWTGVNNQNYGLGPIWGMPTDDVAALHVRANGNLLVAPSGQGLFDWDGSNYTTLIPLLTDIAAVTEDDNGRVWALGRTGGLFHQDDSPLLVQTPLVGPQTIEPDPDEPGWVWVCSNDALIHTDGMTSQTWPRSLLGIGQNTLSQQLLCAARAVDGTFWIGSGSGLFHLNTTTNQFEHYTTSNTPLNSNWIRHLEIAPDGSLWIATYDDTYPYPGGLTHFNGTDWTTYTTANSLLPNNQITCLASRSMPGGYELWIGAAGQAVAIASMQTVVLPGDMNCDGRFDNFDIDPFVLALVDPGTWSAMYPACDISGGDVNHDGQFDNFDIDPFVICIVNGGCP